MVVRVGRWQPGPPTSGRRTLVSVRVGTRSEASMKGERDREVRPQPTVLVTGAGALVGQGVLRLLRQARAPVRIVTADPDARVAGHWLGDKAHLIPMASDASFVAEVHRITAEEQVDAILVGTDVELARLARERSAFEARGVKLVVASPEVIEIADDEWLTADFLRGAGLPYPETALASDPAACSALVERTGLPVFAEPAARGSIDRSAVAVVRSRTRRSHWAQLGPGHPGVSAQRGRRVHRWLPRRGGRSAASSCSSESPRWQHVSCVPRRQ